MKFSLALTVLASAFAEAHYTFPSVGNTSPWQVVRTTTNFQSNGPVTDVTSDQIRCYERNPGTGAPSTYNATAGSTLAYNAGGGIFHPGPMAFYIAQVPSGKTAANWDAKGAVWSKIYQDGPGYSTGGLTWPTLNAQSVSVTLPRCLQNGEYLLRGEHIALHSAGSVGGAQFYLSCAQLSVTGGSGSWNPKNKVSFPGAYSATDPGILINIYYPVPTNYKAPGPAVDTC